MNQERFWQLKMFDLTLKKKQRLTALHHILGSLDPKTRCLLVTCGDNNGAMNYHLRQIGGIWSWAEMESTSIPEMEGLLGEPVQQVSPDRLSYADDTFDIVVSIDCLEHIENPFHFVTELNRICRPQRRVIITVPGGERIKFVNFLKHIVGMTRESYGHVVDGYSVDQLQGMMKDAGIIQCNARTFSRFFTEIIELGINLAYVKYLSRKSQVAVKEGTIAPATSDQLKSVEKTYRLYARVYPLFRAISSLDRLLFFTRGYVTVVEGIKDGR